MLRSDYLLAYLTYHYGWVASGIVVLLLAVFLGLGFRKALKQKMHFRADGFSDDSLHLHSGNPALYSGKSGYMAHRTDCPALPFLWGNGFAHQYGIGRRTAFCIPHG